MKPTRTLLFILFTLCLLLPAGVRAQENISLATLQIDLWPEYDRQEVLVIYRAMLSPGVALPANLTFRIPATSGGPNAVAERANLESQPLNAQYTTDEDGDWLLIHMTITQPGVQIEYYDPSILRDGNNRSFTYQWPGDYAVDSLAIFVQQPAGATSLQTSPQLSQVMQNTYGLFFVWDEIGAMQAGQSFNMSVQYEKETEDLTVNYLPLESSEPVTSDTEGRVDLVNAISWGVGLLGLGLILIGFIWYRGAGKKNKPSKKKAGKQATPQERKRVEPEMGTGEGKPGDNFCHECGKRATSNDKFCRSCGTKLRG